MFSLPVITRNETQFINARDLHATLEVGRDYTTWLRYRIEQYGFEEGEDYIYLDAQDIAQFSGNTANGEEGLKNTHGGDRRSLHIAVSIDRAKELALIENNDKGRLVRRYFIQQEKDLKALMLKAQKENEAKVKALDNALYQLNDQLNEYYHHKNNELPEMKAELWRLKNTSTEWKKPKHQVTEETKDQMFQAAQSQLSKAVFSEMPKVAREFSMLRRTKFNDQVKERLMNIENLILGMTQGMTQAKTMDEVLALDPDQALIATLEAKVERLKVQVANLKESEAKLKATNAKLKKKMEPSEEDHLCRVAILDYLETPMKPRQLREAVGEALEKRIYSQLHALLREGYIKVHTGFPDVSYTLA